MRRAQAILVILVLLSAPLSLLAGSNHSDMAACNGMCCLPHHGARNPVSHHAPAQNHEKSSSTCGHGSNASRLHCLFNCGDAHAAHFFVSPLAPTKASNVAFIERLDRPTAAKFRSELAAIVPGFLAVPFQPPRA
jgi:hypothetical protein